MHLSFLILYTQRARRPPKYLNNYHFTPKILRKDAPIEMCPLGKTFLEEKHLRCSVGSFTIRKWVVILVQMIAGVSISFLVITSSQFDTGKN